MLATFFQTNYAIQMCSGNAERRPAMPHTQRPAMANAMGSMYAANTHIVKTGVVAPVSLFVAAVTLVGVVVVPGNLIISLISLLLLTGLTGLVGIESPVRFGQQQTPGTAMGD